MALTGLMAVPAATLGNVGAPPAVTTGVGGIELADESRDLYLFGWVNPNGADTSCYFEYGPDDPENGPGPYGHVIPCRVPPGSGTEPVEVGAVVAGAHVPPGEAGHFRLVASNVHGVSYGEDSLISRAVCHCGRPPSDPSTTIFGAKAPIVAGEARIRVRCKGGERGCAGTVRLIARKKRSPKGPVETVQLGDGSYELRVGARKVIPIEYPSWSRHLLKRPPSEVRFVLVVPYGGQRQVVEFTSVDF